MKTAIFGQLAGQLRHGVRRVVELTEVADLAIPIPAAGGAGPPRPPRIDLNQRGFSSWHEIVSPLRGKHLAKFLKLGLVELGESAARRPGD